MKIYPIDISKSKQPEKLIFKQGFFDKLSEIIFQLIVIVVLLYMCGLEFYYDLVRNEPIGLSLVLLVLSGLNSALLIYSVINLNSLKRIVGFSRSENSATIIKIAERNKWNIFSHNEQATIINFSWENTGTDWGKQMTILYDGNDVLVNCISFALFSTPSPFHWFTNKRKINKLQTEFENEIKNVLQQRV